MVLAKPLRQNPRSIADNLIKALPASEYISRIEIAGAGFINFYLSPMARQKVVREILSLRDRYGWNQTGNGRKLQVEFVSANPTGPLHVGHGRGAAVADCLCRLLEANGYDVTREVYYNDAGAQINNVGLSVQSPVKGLTPEDESWPADGYRRDYIGD